MGSLRDDLRGAGVEVVETHISWVFIAEGEVWKVKKPVLFPFLDFSTAEKRKTACEAEVELNRRLAPDAYRGVEPVTLDSSGCHRLGGSGAAVDWAVHMVRLLDVDRADVRLSDGRLTASDLSRIAERIAAFHRSARSDDRTASFGSVEAIARNVRENLDQGRAAACRYLGETQADAIEAGQMGFLSDRSAAFEDRAEGGRVLEGHGDLRLDHIYLDSDSLHHDGPNDDRAIRILDCIEFNERFRFLDVCSDVAFLSMDLAFHRRRDLAEHFLASYARASNDYDLYPLVGFYESYRAYVRGMVNGMLAEDGGAAVAVRKRRAEMARRYYQLALASLAEPNPSHASTAAGQRALPSVLLVVGGLVASGKTTMADRVGFEVMAPVVSSDRTRKSLLGAEPKTSLTSAAWTDAYSSEMTEQVYEEVFRRARCVL
jgi:aminoglycoside phosphotransferase family enzyme